MKSVFPVLLFMWVATSLHAQDYDADSVYYTPIDRTRPATVERTVRVFRDTVRHQKFIRYYADVTVGMLTGCHDCVTGTEFTSSTSTAHGITLGRKTRIGAGLGFDSYYMWNVVPVFGSASYDLVGTRNTHAVFVQFNYGYGMAWHTQQTYEPAPADVEGGVMLSAWMGYRIRYHGLRIGIAAGYKRQSTSLAYETPTWVPDGQGGWMPGTPSRTQVNIDLGRAVLNLSLSW